MASTSTTFEVLATAVGENSPANESMNDNEKENCERIRGGETYDIFGKYILIQRNRTNFTIPLTFSSHFFIMIF